MENALARRRKHLEPTGKKRQAANLAGLTLCVAKEQELLMSRGCRDLVIRQRSTRLKIHVTKTDKQITVLLPLLDPYARVQGAVCLIYVK